MWNENLKFNVKSPQLSHMRIHVKEGAGVRDKLDDVAEALTSCKKIQQLQDAMCNDTVVQRIRKKGDADLIGQFCCPVSALGKGELFEFLNLGNR